MYLAWTNIAHSEGVIVFSNCRYALEVIQGGKTRVTQEINYLLLSTETTGKSCNLQWIPVHVDIEGNELTDSLANKARTIEPISLSIAVFDANAK